SVAGILERSGVDATTAAWAAAAGQGHVGRSRRLARDEEARERRAEVLAIPASLTSLQACVAAADHLVSAAEAEAAAIPSERDAGRRAAAHGRRARLPRSPRAERQAPDRRRGHDRGLVVSGLSESACGPTRKLGAQRRSAPLLRRGPRRGAGLFARALIAFSA